MADAEKLRERAAKLFAMALRVGDEGNSDYAKELTEMASGALAQAEELERHAVVPPAKSDGRPAVEQRQPQPYDPDKDRGPANEGGPRIPEKKG
jgi:hypothetical protein